MIRCLGLWQQLLQVLQQGNVQYFSKFQISVGRKREHNHHILLSREKTLDTTWPSI